MTLWKPCTLAAIGLACATAAPRIDKVEPPNWWVPHTLHPVQILLTGADLQDATVSTASKGFKIEVRHTSPDGRYLFVYLDIGREVRPGSFEFQVKGRSGTGRFTFTLEKPLEGKGRFQGFTADDVIYLIMPDRFANGDPANDSPPEFAGPADRKNIRAYHGGDLRGIRDRLPYLKDLGVTGFWLTPVYKNSLPNAGAYHGYSAVDFYGIEPRFGTMKEFRELVDAAHQMGIKVVQDQVANHSGPRHPFVSNPPTPTWFNYLDRTPRPRNNFDIAGLADPYSRPSRRELPLRGWFAGSLPDFNQEDPLAADYIIQNALWWIGMTGIDAIRQDTYPYVDRPFWAKWQAAVDKQYPGFTVVGEVTAPNPASLSFFEGGTAHDGIDTKLPSLLDFPLEHTLRDVFGGGQPMNRLVEILAQDSLYKRPEMLVVFPGNHDQPRLLTVAKGEIDRLMMAEAFVLTTRRVVHLYYGDEIAMMGANDPENRHDFPGGWPGDTADAFTPAGRTGDAAAVFNLTRELLHFRLEHASIRRGTLTNLLVNQNQYVYLRSSPEEHVLVVLNRAGSAQPLSLAVEDLTIPDGTIFRSFSPESPDLTAAGGKLTIAQPGEIQIYWARRTPRPGNRAE